MASICKDSNGKKRILFVNPDGDRKTIRLGKTSLADARVIKHKIESILSAQNSGRPLDNETAAWVRDMPDKLANKLAAAKLIEARNTQTLGELLNDFLRSNSDSAKPATITAWTTIKRDLIKHFGETHPIQSIERAEAEDFRQRLIDRKLAAITIQRRMQFARQFFTHAIQKDWIEKNPFKGVKHKGSISRDRQHYITEEDAQRLIEAAPGYVWRTIIALARYGGLRCPSEVLSLPLVNLDWEQRAIKILSPKTECHGQESRIIPMFARLRPYLEEAWEMAKPGQTHAIPEDLYLPTAKGPRGWDNSRLRPIFERIIDHAGLVQWPRLFHNLRASCESDLVREYPITTVCKWIGNTVSIAARHYVQVTDGDFQKAVKGTGMGVAQKAAQSVQEMGCKDLNPKSKNPLKPESYEHIRCLAYDNLDTKRPLCHAKHTLLS